MRRGASVQLCADCRVRNRAERTCYYGFCSLTCVGGSYGGGSAHRRRGGFVFVVAGGTAQVPQQQPGPHYGGHLQGEGEAGDEREVVGGGADAVDGRRAGLQPRSEPQWWSAPVGTDAGSSRRGLLGLTRTLKDAFGVQPRSRNALRGCLGEPGRRETKFILNVAQRTKLSTPASLRCNGPRSL